MPEITPAKRAYHRGALHLQRPPFTSRQAAFGGGFKQKGSFHIQGIQHGQEKGFRLRLGGGTDQDGGEDPALQLQEQPPGIQAAAGSAHLTHVPAEAAPSKASPRPASRPPFK